MHLCFFRLTFLLLALCHAEEADAAVGTLKREKKENTIVMKEGLVVQAENGKSFTIKKGTMLAIEDGSKTILSLNSIICQQFGWWGKLKLTGERGTNLREVYKGQGGTISAKLGPVVVRVTLDVKKTKAVEDITNAFAKLRTGEEKMDAEVTGSKQQTETFGLQQGAKILDLKSAARKKWPALKHMRFYRGGQEGNGPPTYLEDDFVLDYKEDLMLDQMKRVTIVVTHKFELPPGTKISQLAKKVCNLISLIRERRVSLIRGRKELRQDSEVPDGAMLEAVLRDESLDTDCTSTVLPLNLGRKNNIMVVVAVPHEFKVHPDTKISEIKEMLRPFIYEPGSFYLTKNRMKLDEDVVVNDGDQLVSKLLRDSKKRRVPLSPAPTKRPVDLADEAQNKKQKGCKQQALYFQGKPKRGRQPKQ